MGHQHLHKSEQQVHQITKQLEDPTAKVDGKYSEQKGSCCDVAAHWCDPVSHSPPDLVVSSPCDADAVREAPTAGLPRHAVEQLLVAMNAKSCQGNQFLRASPVLDYT